MSRADAAGYELSDAAEIDLADILRFTVRRWSASQADIYLTGFEGGFQRLAEFPLSLRERTEFSPPVRIGHFQSHIIVYRVEPDLILTDRILHSRSNWNAVLSGDQI